MKTIINYIKEVLEKLHTENQLQKFKRLIKNIKTLLIILKDIRKINV